MNRSIVSALFASVTLLVLNASAQTTVGVTPSGPTRSVAPYFLGFVTQTDFGPSWSDPQFLASIPQLLPEALRYPGGQNGNYWDWQSGWFLASTGYQSGLTPNPYRLQDLKNAVLLTGATPLYMLNILTSDLATQLNLLRSASATGLPVQLIELGNELSLDMPSYVSRFQAGTDYGSTANQWTAAIKSEFPQARIAISTRTGVSWSGGSAREQSWNQQVLASAPNPDAIVMHTYPTIADQFNVPLDGTDPETIAQQTAETAALQDPSAIPKILGVPLDTYARIEANILTLPATFGPQTRIWITEYDLDKSFYAVHGTWLHGLFVGALTAEYLQDSRIELIDYFNMSDNAVHGAMFSSAAGFRNFLNGPATQPFTLSASGWVLREFALALNHMTLAQPLSFTPSPMITRAGAASYPALIGWMFTDGARKSAVILNLGPSAIQLDVSGPSMRPAAVEEISLDPLTRVTGFTAPQKLNAAAGSSVALSPYSVTRLSWQFPRTRAVRH